MTDTRYQLAISVPQIENDLAGAPLSIEIVPELGRAHRALVTASSKPVIENVAGPGKYLIRTTLPSGRRIVEVADVPDKPNESGIACGTIELNLADSYWHPEAEPPPTKRRRFGGIAEDAGRSLARSGKFLASATSSVRTAVGAVGGMVSLSRKVYSPIETIPVAHRSSPAMHPPSVSGTAGGLGGDPARTYDWDTFIRWDPSDNTNAAATLVASRGGTGMIELDGTVRPPTNDERSLLLKVSKVSKASVGDAVIAWLPNSQGRAARVQVDPDGAVLRSGSPLLAYNGQEDAITATLFSYIRRNALEDARTALPELIRNLDNPNVKLGANQRTLAGYVLFKLRDRNAERVIKDLCYQYPTLPDGHVLRAAQLISNGEAEQAGAQFDEAMRYGVPTYTEGVRLLRDGSNFLCDLEPNNDHLRDNARLANRIAAAANFNSELTCLRVGRDIAVADAAM